jgi:hypothetical protein
MAYNPSQVPNFGPLVTDSVIVDNNYFGNELTFYELAKSIEPLVGITPLKDIFPEETIEAKQVEISESYEPIGTTLPAVEMGKPDVFLGQSGKQFAKKNVQPLHIRGSFFVSHGEINSKVKPGTTNDRWSPAEQIQEKVTQFMVAHNLTWEIYRTWMLLGGINYTDTRTEYTINAPANIPAINLWNYQVKSGYQGRAEHALFRTVVDSNTADPGSAPAGIPWTEPDADIINCVKRLNSWYKQQYKAPLTRMFMTAELRDVISMSTQVALSLGNGFLPKLGATAGQNGSTVSYQPTVIPAGGVINGLSLGEDGEIVAIAGIPITIIDTGFKDPSDGIYKRVWPKNKVVFVSEVNSDGAKQAPGRTQFCISEEKDGAPGLWTRVVTDVPPPSAPGYIFQIGNAGLPYFKYPRQILHMTVCSVEDIQKRLVVLGDFGLGVY